MALQPRNDGWLDYTHHRRATIQEWDSGVTLTKTKNGDSQYNPHFYSTDEQIRELELHCVMEGAIIRETANKRTAFMKLNHIVGACSGFETRYAFAECTSGFYHGRPMCEEKLKQLGATLGAQS
jgi:hypothetical protein